MEILGIQINDGAQWMLGGAGGLILGWWAHRLNLSKDASARRAAAAKEFRETVNRALAELPSVDDRWDNVSKRMADLNRDLGIAVENFKTYLSGRTQMDFEHLNIKFSAQALKRVPEAFVAAPWDSGHQPALAREAKQELFRLARRLLLYAQHK